jgi:hypothetical protein
LKAEIGFGVSVHSKVARLHGRWSSFAPVAVHVIRRVAVDRAAGLVCVVAMALIVALVYIPFLHNGLIFDDHNLFTNLSVYDYATTPFSSGPRTFPYFTLGIVQVLFHSIAAQRTVSLALHIACACLLFSLLRNVLERCRSTNVPISSSPNYVVPLAGATWFALNPVAVYGAAYLVERTIVLATLFSLACLCVFVRGFRTRSTSDVIVAAVLYSAAVFCKEHAVLLPFGALPLIAIAGPGSGSWTVRNWTVRHAVLFVSLCLPAAGAAVFAAKRVIATSYEPLAGDMLAQITNMKILGHAVGVWPASMAMQARAFFLYLYYWVMPDVRYLSVDMRVDFANVLGSPAILLSGAAFMAMPVIGLVCLSKGRSRALFGCGLLLSWTLFLPELSSVRLQEPFVLYRSYLWAPGFAIMLVASLARVNWKPVVLGWLLLLPLQIGLARDRLQSLASERAVWEDAAAKLVSPRVPGADRIYFNRGSERAKHGDLNAALDDLNEVIVLSPTSFHGYYGRGVIYLQGGQYARALDDFNETLRIKPEFGAASYRKGLALENLGQIPAALAAYRKAADTGDTLARFRVDYLEGSSGPLPQTFQSRR